MLAVLKEMVNFKLLFNPLFFLIGVSNAVGMIGFYTPFVYLPSMAAQYVNITFILKANLEKLCSRKVLVWRMQLFLSL